MVDKNGSEAVTTIDSLMNILKQKGRSELTVLSSELDADSRVVEKWAKILEDNGLVKVTYVTGRMYIEPVAASTDSTALIGNKISVREAQIDHEIARQKAELDKLAATLERLSSTNANMESILMKSMPPTVRESMAEISRTFEFIETQNLKAQVIRKTAAEEFEKLNKRFSDMIPKAEFVSSQNTEDSLDRNIAKIRQSAATATELRNAIDAINKNEDAAFVEMKKSLEAQLKEANAQIEKSREAVNAQIKEYTTEMKAQLNEITGSTSSARNSVKELETLKKEQQTVGKLLNGLRAKFVSEHGRVTEEIRKAEAVIKRESDQISGNLEDFKVKLSDPIKIQAALSQTQDSISKTREELGNLQGEMARQKARLDGFAATLESLNSATATITAGLKNEMPASISDRMAKIADAYKAIDNGNKKAEEIRTKAEKQFADINTRLDEMFSRMDSYANLKPGFVGMDEKLSKVAQSSKDIEALRASVDSINRDKEKAFADIRNSFNLQIKSINDQIAQARRQIDQQVKSYMDDVKSNMKELSRSADSAGATLQKMEAFKKEQESAIRSINYIKMKFDDRYDEVLGEINKGEALIRKDADEMKLILNDLKSKVGDPLKIADAIRATKVEIGGIKGELNGVRVEVAQMLQQVGSLKKSKSLSMEQQLKILDEILAKSTATGLELTGIKTNIDKAIENISDITEIGAERPKKTSAKKHAQRDDGESGNR